MKKIILLLMSVFALNVTCVYAQELTKKELKEQAEQKKKAEKAKKEAEKERAKQAKKEAKREAHFAKFVEMVNNYEPITLDTKNIASLDTLVKHLNSMMIDVVVLAQQYQSVEMVSEPYVDEDGIPDTLWYARDKTTQQRFTNEEAPQVTKKHRALAKHKSRCAGSRRSGSGSCHSGSPRHVSHGQTVPRPRSHLTPQASQAYQIRTHIHELPPEKEHGIPWLPA